MIALYKGTSALSKAIRFFNWSQYSHASWIDRKTGMEWEAWQTQTFPYPKGNVQKLSQWGINHVKGTKIDLFEYVHHFEDGFYTNATIQKILFFLDSQVGKKYDFGSVLHFVTRTEGDDQNKWFCSELIFAALKYAGINLLERIDACKVYPGMLSYSPLLEYVGTIEVGAGSIEEQLRVK